MTDRAGCERDLYLDVLSILEAADTTEPWRRVLAGLVSQTGAESAYVELHPESSAGERVWTLFHGGSPGDRECIRAAQDVPWVVLCVPLAGGAAGALYLEGRPAGGAFPPEAVQTVENVARFLNTTLRGRTLAGPENTEDPRGVGHERGFVSVTHRHLAPYPRPSHGDGVTGARVPRGRLLEEGQDVLRADGGPLREQVGASAAWEPCCGRGPGEVVGQEGLVKEGPKEACPSRSRRTTALRGRPVASSCSRGCDPQPRVPPRAPAAVAPAPEPGAAAARAAEGDGECAG